MQGKYRRSFETTVSHTVFTCLDVHSSWFLTFGFGFKFSKFFAFDTLFFKKRKIVFKNKIGLADDLVFKYNCNELW